MHGVPATVCRPVDLWLWHHIAGTDEACVELYQTFGILPYTFTCELCRAHIGQWRMRKGYPVWRCNNKLCGRSCRTVRSGSKFLSWQGNRNKLSLTQIAAIVYSWSLHLTLPLSMTIAGVHRNTVCTYFNMFRDVCFEALVEHERDNGPDPYIQSLGADTELVEPPLKAARLDQATAAECCDEETDEADVEAYDAPSTSQMNSARVCATPPADTADPPHVRMAAIAAKYRQFARLDKRRMGNARQHKSPGGNMPRHVAEEWWRQRTASGPGYPGKALFEQFLKMVGASSVYGVRGLALAHEAPLLQQHGAAAGDHAPLHSAATVKRDPELYGGGEHVMGYDYETAGAGGDCEYLDV